MILEPTTALNAVAAYFLGVVFYLIGLQFFEVFQNQSEKYLLSNVALANGLFLALDLAPLGTLATELVALAPAIPSEVSHFASSLLNAATFMNLIVGALVMYDKSEIWGVVGFYTAFVGGFVLPILPLGGILIWALSQGFTSVSSTKRW
jgi:hypothetical protein